MEKFNVEIRDGMLHLSGYVNVVERDSKIINTRDGRCVEQIAAGAFRKSLEDGHEVRMRLNHKRDIGSTADGTITVLREDNVGLYAETVTGDEELRELAANGQLTGWSFGFIKKDGTIETRGADVPRRRIKALDLTEISILSVTPAYNGQSVECRDDSPSAEEFRSYGDYEESIRVSTRDGEPVSVTEQTMQSDGDGDTHTSVVTTVTTNQYGTETVTNTNTSTFTPDAAALKAKVDQLLLREKIKQLREKGYEQEMRSFVLDAKQKQLEYEYRYNHYHDPHNGRFASGAGGGVGLYYSMGKGKGEIIGASSPWQPKKKREGLFAASDLKVGDVISYKVFDPKSQKEKATEWTKTKVEGIGTWKSKLYQSIIVENIKVGEKTTKITGLVDHGDFDRLGRNYGKSYSRYTKVLKNNDIIRVHSNEKGTYHLPTTGAEVRHYSDDFD